MKKLLVVLGVLGLLGSCVSTNKKLVNYNTERLDKIEKYLYENGEVQIVKKDEFNKVREQNQPAIRQQISVEKEADTWVKK